MVSNIIIVNDFAFINGGAGSVAIRTACELSRRGKRVFFFAGVAPVDACLEATGVKVFCLNQYDILNNSNRLEAIIQGLWNQKRIRSLINYCHLWIYRRLLFIFIHGRKFFLHHYLR